MKIKNQFDLTGKVAIITGSSKGIGASIARGLAEFGAKVVVSSRKQEAVDAVVASLKKDGLEATAIACHVGDDAQLKNLVNQTIAKYGGIDILINNAATNPVFEPIVASTSEAFDKIMSINVKACMLLSNYCYPSMKSRGGGSIVNIASVEGITPSFGMGMYSISKAALIMLTKSMAKEWGDDKIRVNAICPGLIQTKFSSALWQNEDILNKVVGDLPAARMAQPDEMAGLAIFLASNASSYSTGAVHVADGGYLVK
ncbi:MAG TPA: glucose 1-dehydrogenase [Phaeodactylibacter sp.]|nr:glucose 1-dehydrogenase [Phaeodactylibacter sp.]